MCSSLPLLPLLSLCFGPVMLVCAVDATSSGVGIVVFPQLCLSLCSAVEYGEQHAICRSFWICVYTVHIKVDARLKRLVSSFDGWMNGNIFYLYFLHSFMKWETILYSLRFAFVSDRLFFSSCLSHSFSFSALSFHGGWSSTEFGDNGHSGTTIVYESINAHISSIRCSVV